MQRVQNPDMVMLGIMGAMRTGNLVLDMVVCMLIPIIFSRFVQWFNESVNYVMFLARDYLTFDYVRTIENTEDLRPWRDGDNSSHKNGILLRAIRMYIGREMTAKYNTADVKLTAVMANTNNRGGSRTCNTVDQLEKKYVPTTGPRQGVFIEIEPGLHFCDTVAVIDEEGKKSGGGQTFSSKRKTTYTFKCRRQNGKERVDKFIEKVFAWYVKKIEENEDNSRFMYQPLVTKESFADDKKDSRRVYRRYELSEDKTFNSLFFPEKPRLMGLLGHFQERTGKYAIRGFPHKMGLLLHGPPGTGKTSLVKAIAVHTQRHIISVPLSRIRTNQELMDVMFDQVFPFGSGKDDDEEESVANKLKFDEVIFLLEDVDAASTVVHSRQPPKDGQSTAVRELSAVLSSTYAPDGTTDSPEAGEGRKGSKGAGMLSKQASRQMTAMVEGDKEEVKESKFASKWEMPDKLDLAGLLNVLDGVVDSPGRILIMTTNHPEKLDPALTRPGRINMQIYMGYIKYPEATEMANHYYPLADHKQLAIDLRKTFETAAKRHGGLFKLSPAEMEQLCAECPTPQDLITRLSKK